MKKVKFLGAAALAVLLILVVGVLSLERADAEPKMDPEENALALLPVIGTYEQFIKILKEVAAKDSVASLGLFRLGGNSGFAAPASGEARDGGAEKSLQFNDEIEMAADSAGGGAKADFSETNVQVAGVDEADIIKTDGEYIYAITHAGDKAYLVIVKAYSAGEGMEVAARMEYAYESGYTPGDMYIDGDHLVLLGGRYGSIMPVPYAVENDDAAQKEKVIEDVSGELVRVVPGGDMISQIEVFDISDKHNPKQVRKVELEGSIVSSRKIGDIVYVVSNKYIPYQQILRGDLSEDDKVKLRPAYKDTLLGEEVQRIAYPDIAYFPGSVEPNYLIVASLDLNSLQEQKVEVQTYLGSGQSIYASAENLYVSVPEYNYQTLPSIIESRETAPAESLPEPITEPAVPVAAADASSSPTTVTFPNPTVTTKIYKFALEQGEVVYSGQGQVPGAILNQFSMDEYNGYFRIATTYNLENNLYVLGADMNRVGSLEKLAPGERIYSVRFMGSRAYMVTFETVDPLFVIDLGDPQKPSVLGELKIPGYSNYLHPYDENHLIGIGKEALEIKQPGWDGQETAVAYYLGLKIALFDVSDVNNPVEKYKVEIGDRGSESEVFWNHKAFLFDREKGLLALPVTVASNKNLPKEYYSPYNEDPRLVYGQPIFQGAYIYNLTLDQGFEFRGGITHQASTNLQELHKNGQYDYLRDINRILYIGDMLYTFSPSYLRANDLKSLDDQGFIKITP